MQACVWGCRACISPEHPVDQFFHRLSYAHILETFPDYGWLRIHARVTCMFETCFALICLCVSLNLPPKAPFFCLVRLMHQHTPKDVNLFELMWSSVDLWLFLVVKYCLSLSLSLFALGICFSTCLKHCLSQTFPLNLAHRPNFQAPHQAQILGLAPELGCFG